MNKEERRINNKCNFIDNLLIDNGLYEGVSALLEVEEHISNLYNEIDNYKHQLEEKDKVINVAFNKIETLRMEKWAIMGTDIMEILEILESGKNGK